MQLIVFDVGTNVISDVFVECVAVWLFVTPSSTMSG